MTLYAAEFLLLIMALAIYRLGDRALASSLGSTPASRSLWLCSLFWPPLQLLHAATSCLAASTRASFVFTAAMNLITVALIFIPVETAVRLLSRSVSDATVFLNTETILYPRSWEKAAAIRRELVDKASGALSYLVYDETLG